MITLITEQWDFFNVNINEGYKKGNLACTWLHFFPSPQPKMS